MSSSLLGIGLSGLNAAQWGLNVTGQNISNASTPGYSLERTAYGETQYTSAGYAPAGVTVSTVQREYSQYLTTALNNAQAQGSALSTCNGLLSQLNSMVGDPTGGISSAVSTYFAGLQNVANDPANSGVRQATIGDAQVLANQINTMGQQYDQLRQTVNAQVSDTVQQINSAAAQIASLNKQIAAAGSTTQPPNQLLDQRDQAVASLSNLIGVQAVQNSDGVGVFMSNGLPLVQGNNCFQLGAAPSSGDQQETSVTYLGLSGADPVPPVQNLPDAAVTGGSLGGLLTFRSQTLDPSEAQLGAIVTSVAAQVNAQNALGVDESGNPGSNLFSVASPHVQADSGNSGSAKLSAALTNAANPPTSDYVLSFDGTNYKLTDQASGKVVGTTTNLANPIGGLQFSLNGTMNAGDSFEVQPTRGALNSFSLAATDGASIAAATPVLATTGLSNSGSATITQGSVAAGYVVSGSTTLSYSAGNLTGFPAGATVTVAGPPSATYAGGAPVPYDPAVGATLTINGGATLNAVTVTISGTPGNGDTFVIGPSSGTSTDGRNAQLLSNLVNAKQLGGGTSTFTDAYAGYVNTIGSQSAQVTDENTVQTGVVAQLTAQQQAVSGVNINEEAANLINYQQMYQANAKVIQTASTVFQTLLGIFQ